MNLRCPNCGAVFPAPTQAVGATIDCPLCLHAFQPAGAQTLSIAGPAPIPAATAPPLDLPEGDDEFEAFGTPAAGLTSTFGGGRAAARTTGRGGASRAAGTTGGFGARTSGPSAGAADPFAAAPVAAGGAAGASRAGDPFANDPFGADPFGGGGRDPFAAQAGGATRGVGRGAGDPGGAKGSPTGPHSAGSSADAGGDVDFDALLGAVSAPPTPAAGRPPPTTLSDLDDDSLFGGDDDSLFVANASTSGALFDDAQVVGAEDKPRKQASTAAVTTDTSDRRQPEHAARPKRDWGPTIDRALLAGLAILGIGLALDYQGIPAFGLSDLLPSLTFGGGGDDDNAAQHKRRERPVASNLLQPTPIDDTAASYALEVSRLKQVSAARPDDASIRQALLAAYLDLRERGADEFNSDPSYKTELDAIGPPSLRAQVLAAVAAGDEGVDDLIGKLGGAADATADDLGAAALARLTRWRERQRLRALAEPGLLPDPTDDPMRRPAADDAGTQEASAWIDRALKTTDSANNRVKFQIMRAQLDDAMGRPKAVSDRLMDFVAATPQHPLAHELLASAWIDQNDLGKAQLVIRTLLTWSEEQESAAWIARAMHLEARLAARRGRHADQIVALQGVLQRSPEDELTTVRLGRLLLREKRAQDCQRLLVAAKKADMKSIAFEVALVEFWLWAHRYDDALAELKEATTLHPDAIDLLFLRGQVEDRQQHSATARDFFAQVLSRDAGHLRAALRLAELQRDAGRPDDAVATLQGVRARVGDLEAVLEPLATLLQTLKRDDEARALYTLLLKKAPSNKTYLLEAARMDLRSGQTDRALGYLQILKKDNALDRDGAIALASGLADKGRHSEAAEVLLPFAEREPNSVAINAAVGKYLLDAGKHEHAETMLARAHTVAMRSGGDAETTFQYGRLAFAKGEVDNALTRMSQAIQADPKQHAYRFEFAGQLMKLDRKQHPTVAKVALDQLEFLVAHAPRFAEERNPISYLSEVHKRAAMIYGDEARWAAAIPHLRAAAALARDDLDVLVLLGRALFQVTDPEAESVLRKVLARRSGDAQAALYLALTLIQRDRSSDALAYLEQAASSRDLAVVEASYHAALIYKDRGQRAKALQAVRSYLARAPAGHAYVRDAKDMQRDLAE